MSGFYYLDFSTLETLEINESEFSTIIKYKLSDEMFNDISENKKAIMIENVYTNIGTINSALINNIKVQAGDNYIIGYTVANLLFANIALIMLLNYEDKALEIGLYIERN